MLLCCEKSEEVREVLDYLSVSGVVVGWEMLGVAVGRDMLGRIY